jgi:hypothetical protein
MLKKKALRIIWVIAVSLVALSMLGFGMVGLF